MTEKIKKYFDCDPARYAVLVRFNLSQDFAPTGEMEQQLSIVLAEEYALNDRTLAISFFGVRDLKLKQPDLSLFSFGFIDIRKDGLSYSVVEDEGNLRLACRDFNVTLTQ